MNKSDGINKICVYGVGGVGGYFGGRIAHNIITRKEKNREIYFIARGEHLEAVKGNGIRVVTPEQTITGIPNKATDDLGEIPDPDLFLICVKSYDLDETVKAVKSKVNDNTLIIPLLNGADIYYRIRANLENGVVLPACVYIGTHIQSAGVIRQGGGDGKILFGKDPRFPDFVPDKVIRLFDDMGLNQQWNDDPFPAIWIKYIFIAPFGLVSVFTGKTLGEMMEDDKAKELVSGIMQEVRIIAREKGVALPENIIEESMNKANSFPYETKTSYQRDVEVKGKVNEGDLYGGTITREGEALGIPTPVTKAIYSEIQNRLAG